ncbi:hypothetical protein OSH39_12760 [Mycobacterium ulcerans]|uniref:Uncharacterized protein n=2 Tax=Mycobacterium ulcerans TaxID=1809 RepID=Q6MZ98_MYCUA|nr:hypothetical protein [Mycobacterium ulcerans]CAE46817.1 hypothetical protein MUP006c [Mycobacterium ulcerans Agy99]MEB3905713.1 hypothetical protein [Mycobacterium ulcerans]MEB3909878.1 hypothetical protein [Mycobacterium ulcerans]MEB3920142.1 hypothetical protein [Mycobacterium ulcerans]MEB3924268.1 hypothetical protein [Mycobacterium ulcerans]
MSTQLKQLRAFLAAAGYPDPAAVTQERTIWAAVQHLTPTSRICSASSMRQAATVIDPEILKAVQTVYSTDLGLPEEWTPAQRMEFLTAEADKISSMAASMAETLWEQAITAWTRSRNGQTPNHATKVALLGDARAQAVTRVLNSELYELIETEETDETDMSPPQSGQPIPHRNQVDWQQRWTNPIYQSDPTPDLKALIDRLWPASDFSAPRRWWPPCARSLTSLRPPVVRRWEWEELAGDDRPHGKAK